MCDYRFRLDARKFADALEPMRRAFLSVLFLAGCASIPPAPSAAPVIAAERAFAADAGVRGWVPAFRASAAPDGFMLSPDVVSAPANMASTDDDGFTGLSWRPAFAGMAQSGDFGFTTGPFFARGQDGARGHYFTVWRKQADGSWKWIFDGGVPVTDAAPIDVDAAVLELAPSAHGAGSAEAALAEVGELEARIGWSGGDALGALRGALAEDVRLNRPGQAPALGRSAAEALIARDPAPLGFTPLRAEASAAGDLVFALGEVWRTEGEPQKLGHYARIWQRRAEGWRIVFDEIIPYRPPS
jgi:ketosteroid isomerase-like protein